MGEWDGQLGGGTGMREWEAGIGMGMGWGHWDGEGWDKRNWCGGNGVGN